MTSKYGLISIADLVSEVKLPFNTYVDSSSNRIYSDTDIEATISNAERLVCGWLDNQGLTSTTAHDLIIYAVTLLSSMDMQNALLRDGYINPTQYSYTDLIPYFKDVIQPILKDKKEAYGIKEVQGVDSYIEG